MIKLILGDCVANLKQLADSSVHTCVTSPPYFGLRDYGVEGQIGREKTLEDYVEKMVSVFREVRRALRDDGTLWLNLGDSYSVGGRGGAVKQNTNKGPLDVGVAGFAPKQLLGVPWRVAFALQADGWYLRQDIIWHKPNPMPESATDRCTKAHEYLFLFAKSPKYYFDARAIKEPQAQSSRARRQYGWTPRHHNGVGVGIVAKAYSDMSQFVPADGMRNKRSVWTITTKSYRGAHFATFPPDLIYFSEPGAASRRRCHFALIAPRCPIRDGTLPYEKMAGSMASVSPGAV